MYVPVSCVDESSEEEVARGESEEEQDLGVVKSWMEVGASNTCQRRGTEIIVGGISLAWYLHDLLAILPLFHFTFLFVSLIFMISSIISFFSGFGFTEKSQITEGRSSVTGDWGAGKNWSSSGKIRGRRSIQASEGSISHSSISSIPPPPKRTHHTPSTTISRLPPQEAEEAVLEASAPWQKM